PAPAVPAPAAPTAPAAADAAARISRTARLQAFLAERYGAAATLSGSWPSQWEQDGQTHALDREVCAEQPVVSGDGWHQLLAVCGALRDAGHPEPGTIDFYVLRPEGQRFAVAAERVGGTYGSQGRPGEVGIVRAGSDFYGFRVEDGWFGQGYSLQSQTLILPGPKGLVDAGTLRSHIDNTAAADCDDADAAADCRAQQFNLDFALHFDDHDRAARVWPLRVEETGIDCGNRKVRREHRFTLDPKTWTYAFPEALQREGCS
ncbi:hypothetical protein, partial [Xanthomonas bonasiae]|uniref:hypothetical protein n=1 Tax=Xanthomonas bonasiae TaxID=2810351 RepID=UPI00197DE0FC